MIDVEIDDGQAPAIGQLVDAVSSRPLGTAFAVSRDRAITCWHCVDSLPDATAAEVILRLFAASSLVPVDVAAHVEDHNADLDLALLKLDEDIPSIFRPLMLRDRRRAEHEFSTRGWPTHNSDLVAGTPIVGRILDSSHDQGRRILVLDDPSAGAASPLAKFGFSGAPVRAPDGAAIAVIRRVPLDLEHPDRAIGGMTYAIPASDVPGEWRDLLTVGNPYQEPLRAFDQSQAASFHGRDDAVDSLRAALLAAPERVVTLAGASGTGKSSLIRAGLLGRRKAIDTGSEFVVPPPDRCLVIDRYDASRIADLKTFGSSLGDHPGLLVLDQFEQVLQQGKDDIEAVRSAVHNILLRCSGLRLVVAVRTDFLGIFELKHEAFYRLLRSGLVSGATIDLDVSRRDLELMCTLPADSVGLFFEAGVVAALVQEVVDAHRAGPALGNRPTSLAPPTVLPLVSITLWRLAEQVHGGNAMTRQSFEQLGGVRGAVAKWADDAFRRASTVLDDPGAGFDQLAVLDLVLLRLVRVGAPDSPPGRRFVDLVQLRDLAPEDQALDAIESLRAAGLVYVDRAPAGPSGSAVGDGGERRRVGALMHDSLVTMWPRLANLVDRATPTLQWKQQAFDHGYQEWQRDPVSRQLRGTDLASALAHVATTPAAFSRPERAYIERQRIDARREAIRRRSVRTGVPALVIAALVSTAFVVVLFTQTSDRRTRDAVQAAGSLVQAASSLEYTDPIRARALLLEAYRQRPDDPLGRSALARAVTFAPGLLSAQGSTISPSIAVSDPLEVIGTSDSGGCFTTTEVATDAIGPPMYCGATAVQSLVASPDGRVIAARWLGATSVRISVWQRGARRATWTVTTDSLARTKAAEKPSASGVGSASEEVAVGNDGTVVDWQDGRRALIVNGATHRPSLLPLRVVKAVQARARNGIRSIQVRTARDPIFMDPAQSLVSSGVPSQLMLSVDATQVQPVLRRIRVSSRVPPIVSRDGQHLFTLGSDGVDSVDIGSGRSTRLARLAPSDLTTAEYMALSPSDTVAVVTSYTNRVVEVNLRSVGVHLLRLAPVQDPQTVTAGDDGDLVVSSFSNWYAYSAQQSVETGLATGSASDYGPQLSPDGRSMAVASDLTEPDPNANAVAVELVSVASASVIARTTVAGLQAWTWSGASTLDIVTADNSVLGLGTNGATHPIGHLPAHSSAVLTSSGRVAVATNGHRLSVYDIHSGRLLRTIPLAIKAVVAPVSTAVGDVVVAPGATRAAVIRDAGGPSPQVTYVRTGPGLTGSGGAATAARPSALLAADGSVLVTTVSPASAGTVLTIVRIPSGASSTVNVSSSTNVSDIAVSADQVAVLADGGEIDLYDLLGNLWAQIPAPPSSEAVTAPFDETPTRIAFSGDAHQLVTNGHGVDVLTLDPARWAASICATDPVVSSDDYRRFAGVGVEQPLCPGR